MITLIHGLWGNPPLPRPDTDTGSIPCQAGIFDDTRGGKSRTTSPSPTAARSPKGRSTNRFGFIGAVARELQLSDERIT